MMIPSKFKFSNPILESCSFCINSEFIRKVSTKESEIKELRIPLQTITGKGKVKDNKCIVFVKVDIGDETGDYPFHLAVRMSAKFFWKDSFSKKEIQGLLKINAPALLLSYIRPIVVGLTAASPFPPYQIPFMNFTESNHEQTEPDKRN